MSFNTLGDDENKGTILTTGGDNGYRGQSCKMCGCPNHATKDCFAKHHADGTLLHIDASIDEDIDWEVEETRSVPLAKKYGNIGNDIHELVFMQSDRNKGGCRARLLTQSLTRGCCWIANLPSMYFRTRSFSKGSIKSKTTMNI